MNLNMNEHFIELRKSYVEFFFENIVYVKIGRSWSRLRSFWQVGSGAADKSGTAQYFYKFSTYSSLFLQLNIPTQHFLYVFCLFLEFFCWLVLGTILSLI
jgi:hypothetical protein